MSSGVYIEPTIAHVKHGCGFTGLTDAWWDPEQPHQMYIQCAQCKAEWEETR